MMCGVEGSFVQFTFQGAVYNIGVIYLNGNVYHSVSALEYVLHKINTNRTTLLAEDVNTDIIKFSYEDRMAHMSTLKLFKYLPYDTVVFHLT